MRDDTASRVSPSGGTQAANLLTATGVSRVYRNGKGVFDINLKLQPGEIVGLMGPNGSGKTTLLRVLATAAMPTAGQLSWFGSSDPRDPSVRRRLGIMLDQAAHFEQMTGYQNAWFFARQFGVSEELCRQRLEELFAWADLAEAHDQLVSEYSLGMKRRLNLIEALVHRPSLLLLDEPSLALDYRGELDLIERMQLLTLTGTGVVLTTNHVHLAERLCDYVLFLHHGRVIREGRVTELLTEVAGSKEVQLQLTSPAPLENLRALPGVQAATADGDVVRVVLARDANPAHVLAALDGHTDLLSAMRVRRPNLGDLFLKLTGVALPIERR